MWWSGNYGVELSMTLADARSCSHSGQCDADVMALMRRPNMARQLRALDPEKVRRELKDYGAWDEEELSDHQANLARLVWIAAGDLNERR